MLSYSRNTGIFVQNSHTLDHSHKPDQLRYELVTLIVNYNLKIDHISVVATLLATIATSATILTFLSIQLFMNSLQSISR